MTTIEIDRIVHEETVKRDSYPSPLGYHKFPRSVCTSINEVICHGQSPWSGTERASAHVAAPCAGIPDSRPLEDGDILNLDISLYHGGFHADVNATCECGSACQRN